MVQALLHFLGSLRAGNAGAVLAAVTLEQLNTAWRRYIDPARMAVAWGGDFEGKKGEKGEKGEKGRRP